MDDEVKNQKIANKNLTNDIEEQWISATKTQEEQNIIWAENEVSRVENSKLLDKNKYKAYIKLGEIYKAKDDKRLEDELKKKKQINHKKIIEDKIYAKNIQTTFDKLNRNLANTFENGLYNSLSNGFEDIGSLVEDLGDTIEQTLNRDFSNVLTSAIFGTPVSDGNIFANMFSTNVNSEKKSDNGEVADKVDDLIKDSNTNQKNLTDTNKETSSNFLESSVNFLTSTDGLKTSVNYLNDGIEKLGFEKFDTSYINENSSILGAVGGGYTGYNIGSSIGSKLAPHSYANYGFGVAGGIAGGAMSLGGLSALTLNPAFLPALGVIALASTMFGSKYKAQEGFRFSGDVNGKLDKEELSGIDAYTWYKQKTGSIFGNSSSTYKYKDLSLTDKSFLTSSFNSYDTFSTKLGGQSLSLEESELKQSGRGRGLTAKKLEEVLVKETLSNIMDIPKNITETLTNSVKTIENPDLTEVYKYYEDYAKASEKSITEVISEVFGGLIAFDSDFNIKTASLYGNDIEANRLQKEGYSETIKTISDNLEIFGVNVDDIDMSNLNEVESAIKNLTPTKENIEAYETLANAVYELEKANISYVDSISQDKNISDEKLAKYWALTK